MARWGLQPQKQINKVVPVLNQAPQHEDIRRRGGTAPSFLISTLQGEL